MDFSLQNTMNRAAGQSFEELITESLAYYYEKGYASIEKTPEPMRVLKQNADHTFTAVYTKKAQPDYKGVLLGGQAIIFDAKFTANDRIRQEAVTKEQELMFERYQKMDAQCFVVVSIQGTDFYRVPWNTWKGMKEMYGHKYMNKQELERYRIRMRQVLLLLEGIELREYRKGCCIRDGLLSRFCCSGTDASAKTFAVYADPRTPSVESHRLACGFSQTEFINKRRKKV